jgi:capsular exopolysaccharide synthesis family protein
MLKQSSERGFSSFEPNAPVEASLPKLGDVWATVKAMLQRRLATLLAVSATVLAAALVAILILPSHYVAVTRVRIDPSLNPMTQDQGQGPIGAEVMETEAGLMSSRALALAVVQKLHLDRDPEFASPMLGGETLPVDQVVTRVMKNVSVNRDQLSYILSLAFKARSAEKSALVANAFADTYLDMRVHGELAASAQQADFFRQRLSELAKDVNEADAKLASYRAGTGLSDDGTGGNVVDQQIGTLSGQLASAQAEAAAARSTAAVAQGQVKSGNADSVTGVQGSNVIRDLRSQRADIVRNLGEVEGRYGPKHPESIRAHQQLADVDQQIQDEAQRVVNSLQAQARAGDAQVGSLRSAMAALESARARNTRNSADAERLERDATSVRAQFDKMSALSLESTQASHAAIAQAQIVDRAQPSSKPAPPGKPLLCVLACVIALGCGFAVILTLEMMQGGLRTIGEIESRFGLPVLASVPREGGRKHWFAKPVRISPADLIGSAGATVFGEAIRNLRASLIGVRQASTIRVVGFTSALPGEGKTTTALAFARMLAVNGARVLLIDADLRNSKFAQSLRIDLGKGLIEVLRGKARLKDAVVADRISGLDILPVATTLFVSRDIFSAATVENLFDIAREDYEYIVVDLPPVLGVADARLLAAMADATVFIVRWGCTQTDAAALALSSLHNDAANIQGVVYTMVDPASETIGGLYYNRNSARYYQPRTVLQ